MARFPLVVVLALTVSCGKPTCPADDLECLFASFRIADYRTAPDGPWEKLYRVDQRKLSSRAGGADVTLSLVESELVFDDSDDSAALGATWTDSAGCRPSLCFSACISKLSCFAYSRCTPARRDGLVTQTTAHWVEYEKAPSSNTGFEAQVIAVSAPGCPADLTALIEDPAQTLFVSEPAWVKFVIPGKGTQATGGGGGGAGGGSGSGGGGGTCPNGFVGSTRLAIPNGTGGCTATTGAADQCLTSADFAGTGIPFPGQCAPSGTTGCFSNGNVAKPCCGALRCVVGTACGGDATVGGKCMN